MPQAANISALNAAGTAVVFNTLVPASGDKSAALWRPEAIGASPALRPRLEIKAQANGAKTARRVELYMNVPYTRTDTASGITSVAATMPFRVEATLPGIVPDAVLADAVAYFQSVVNSTLFKDTLKSGFAPS